MSITSAFDGGNIELVEAPAAGPVRLHIKPDPFTFFEKKNHLQWFSFRSTASSRPGTVITYEIVNAGQVSYPTAWPGYEVCVSTNRHTWTRVASTTYEGERGALVWEYDHSTAPAGTAYFAFFDPYICSSK